jgi:hypothetical protein
MSINQLINRPKGLTCHVHMSTKWNVQDCIHQMGLDALLKTRTASLQEKTTAFLYYGNRL